MSQDIELTADDGHKFGCYRADPEGKPRAGIVVIQEIFGVNKHIRELCDGFAADGYLAVAPNLYDRSSKRGVALGYTAEDIAEGRRYRDQFSWDNSMRDLEATARLMKSDGLKVGAVGYCWGGTMAYLAGTRLALQAAVVYYGGQIVPFVNERAKCPMQMHFGEHDKSIPLEDVDTIRSTHPEAQVFVYDADHGFACDHRGSYKEAAATQARQRTMAFFAQHLG
jgi:carboxymethylenebutenolidase